MSIPEYLVAYVSMIKTSENKRKAFDSLAFGIKCELIRAHIWDDFRDTLSVNAYNNYNEWFDNEYLGSKQEKLEAEKEESKRVQE